VYFQLNYLNVIRQNHAPGGNLRCLAMDNMLKLADKKVFPKFINSKNNCHYCASGIHANGSYKIIKISD